ncbi:hypothetical protein EAS64_33830 [Trebonia kvetii]|uniref:Terminase n=1 Tax=Trebonia kvetii TaxID=2480626 RepID=A0A6P2BS58_9ACTN|nr:hypothetical protein [Trebonia kvetii]TVZ01261.1 hypothetical protein EAS64_33830 [Trebonia kvetii]
MLWAHERANAFLWSKQREIAYSVVNNKRTAVHSAHGIGKSYLAATLAAWWVDTHPADETMVVTTAPSLDQVHAVLWEEIRGLHDKAGLKGVVQRTDRWVVDGRLVGMGRKPPDYSESAFSGIHRRYVLVLLDEACGIPAWLWTAVETITTGDDCRILAIGNPDDPQSRFRYVCQGMPGWESFKISVFDSPNFTDEDIPANYREVFSKVLTTQQWAKDMAGAWGMDNPLYVAKVLGEFPTDNPWSVVRMSDVSSCRIAAPRLDSERMPVELGVDVGGGLDETVIRERRGMVAGREWRELSDQPETISRLILGAIKQTGATAVKIDSIGVGAGVVGEMKNLKAAGVHNAKIYGVNVAEKAHDPNKYFNLRSQIWWDLGRLQSQEREWDLSRMDNADSTVAQLLEVHYEHDLKGRVKVEPKDEVRKRIGRSPDNADALLLAYYVPKSGATDWFDAAMNPGAAMPANFALGAQINPFVPDQNFRLPWE